MAVAWYSRGVFGRLAEIVLAHRWATSVIAFLSVSAAIAGVHAVRVDFSSKAFYGGDPALLAQMSEFTETWGADDSTLIIVVRAVDGGVIVRPEYVSAIEMLGDAIEDVAQVRSVRSVANVPIDNGRGAYVFAADLPADRIVSSAVVPILVSADGTVGALVVDIEFSSDDVQAVLPIIERIRGVVEASSPQLGLTSAIAGLPAIRAAFYRLTVSDQLVFVPLGLALIGLLLWSVFRRAHGVIIPAAAAGIPTLMLLGALGWAGEPIGLLNQAYFTLLPVIAVADAIHIVSRYHEASRELAPNGTLSAEAQRAAIVTAMRHVGAACSMTSLTTALGFLSLRTASMPILRSFGTFAAVGVVFAFAVAVTIVPLLLSFSRPVLVPESNDRIGPKLQAITRAAIRRPVVTLIGAALTLAFGIGAANAVVIDNRLTALLEPSHPIRVASSVVDRDLGGILSLEVDLSGPPGSVITRATLPQLEAFEEWSAAQPEVRAVLGPSSRLRRFEHLLITSPSSGDYEVLRDVLGDVLPKGTDGTRARISLRVADIGGVQFAALEARVSRALDRYISTMGATITGTTVVAYRGVNRITRELNRSLILLFAAVSLLIGVLFRSPRLGLIALLPNALPLVLGMAAFGATGIALDPLAAVIMTMGLGIAVDDTIHIIARMNEEREAGADVQSALTRTIGTSGRAVAITTVALTVGLAINLFSSFPPLKMLGALGGAIMMFALLADLIILPALLSFER